MCIPDALWVYDDHRAVAALIEASGLVNANLFLQATRRDLFAQDVQDFFASFSWASFAGDADEYVFLENFCQCCFLLLLLD